MSTELKEVIETQISVKCKICNEEIAFDVNDAASFLSKTDHPNFFGKILATYRIEHQVNGEKHLNAVLLDHQNIFRGYIDAYRIPILQEEQQLTFTNLESYILLEEEIETLLPNDNFTNFFIVNLSGWVLEVVKMSGIKTDAILKSIFDKIEESKNIYETIPQPLNVVIADLSCFIWTKGKTHLMVTTQNKEKTSKYSTLLEDIANDIENNIIIPKKRIFKIFNNILAKTDLADDRPDLIIRLLSDDLLYSRIETRYPERISEIIPKISRRHTISENIIENLLLGKTSIIELLEEEPELITDCRDIIEILDFINRRKLLI